MNIKELTNEAIAESFVVNYAANCDTNEDESELIRRGLTAETLEDVRLRIPSDRDIEDMGDSEFDEAIKGCIADILAAMGPQRARQVYYILSGEGECGSWKRVESTPYGIRKMLTRERCHGDRWAHAYADAYRTQLDEWAARDIETGAVRTIPADMI